LVLDKEYDNTICFKVIDEISRKDLKGKDKSIIKELINMKDYVSKTDPSKYNRTTIKQLRPPLYPMYEANIGKTSL
jgi:hypothetical protein